MQLKQTIYQPTNQIRLTLAQQKRTGKTKKKKEATSTTSALKNKNGCAPRSSWCAAVEALASSPGERAVPPSDQNLWSVIRWGHRSPGEFRVISEIHNDNYSLGTKSNEPELLEIVLPGASWIGWDLQNSTFVVSSKKNNSSQQKNDIFVLQLPCSVFLEGWSKCAWSLGEAPQTTFQTKPAIAHWHEGDAWVCGFQAFSLLVIRWPGSLLVLPHVASPGRWRRLDPLPNPAEQVVWLQICFRLEHLKHHPVEDQGSV